MPVSACSIFNVAKPPNSISYGQAKLRCVRPPGYRVDQRSIRNPRRTHHHALLVVEDASETIVVPTRRCGDRSTR